MTSERALETGLDWSGSWNRTLNQPDIDLTLDMALAWIEMRWNGLDWIGLDWTELDWAGHVMVALQG